MICIYAIINILDDKHYVGQAEDKDYRWREHHKQLRGFYHHNIHLQRAWSKHGEDNFIFLVLEVLESKDLLNERETHWAKVVEAEYNIAPPGQGMRGYKHTEEARENMSKAHMGQKWTDEERRKKLSERMKGNTFNNGRKQSPEVIEHRTSFIRGRKESDLTRVKKSWAMTGFKHTEASRRKMSDAALNRHKLIDNT